MLKKNFKGRINKRRISALARLENSEKTRTEGDAKRITGEIDKLKSLIVAPEAARGMRSKKDRSATGKRKGD